ncbi:hypothetical protein HGM15179_001622 [Zosterops borbonicus]|uniref:Uncharacterized protein n=1 Tax=Zosterops borbonicus TaxID=364589 RepID=A0A8K1LTY6_9PASS|nr:hypothetical protein HGM15179_001622 [Zosterops borbonicus]
MEGYRLGQSGWKVAQRKITQGDWSTTVYHEPGVAHVAKKANGILTLIRNSVATGPRLIILLHWVNWSDLEATLALRTEMSPIEHKTLTLGTDQRRNGSAYEKCHPITAK